MLSLSFKSFIKILPLFLFMCSCSSPIENWQNRIETSSIRDVELILDSIHQKDQNYRQQIEFTKSTYGRDSKELENLWKIIQYTDSSNLEVVKLILDNKGWLGSEEVGYKANMTLFLVIQHADLNTQLEYLPMMTKAVQNGKAKKRSFALLLDRIALRQGKKQIYGSQIGTNSETGEYYMLPLQNPDSVDFRRAEMGLGKLDYYTRQFGFTWDSEAYKKAHSVKN